jgi:flagellar motility protein MotE (MotC chaperone)
MARYTFEDLCGDVKEVNAILEAHNSDYALVPESRNGYTALDLMIRESGKVTRTVATGTPRECKDSAYAIRDGECITCLQRQLQAAKDELQTVKDQLAAKTDKLNEIYPKLLEIKEQLADARLLVKLYELVGE